MKVVIQRVTNASVTVDQKKVGTCENGLMILTAFHEKDTMETIKKMAHKVVNLRIFPDENNIMNKSLLDIGGSILSISQFTLYADTKKGNRPSYHEALSGDKASLLYENWNEELQNYTKVETGIFGADMQVTITNIGPTTIIIEM